MGQGVVGHCLRKPYLLNTKGTASQQEELRGDGGAEGESLGLFTFKMK